jgi:TP901 family phage tail tape measure protein
MAEGQIKAVITAKDTASSVFRNFGGTVVTLNQSLEVLQKGMRVLVGPIIDVIEEGKAFGSQMATVQAVTKASTKEFKLLKEEALRLGKVTPSTAIEAGSAMEELGRAGQDTAQILTTTNAALSLAAANNLALNVAAKSTAVTMNVFKDTGITARETVDLMNKTVASAPLNFESLGFALDYAQGTASAAGWSFGDLTHVIGAMAEAGVEGSKAGTALSTAIAQLMNPSAEAKKALDKYGISLDQINPAQVKFADILDVLKDKQVKQSDLFKILGLETAPKFFKVIQEGGDSIRNYAKKQAQANTAAESAAIQLNNLKGDTQLYNSALSGLKLEVYEQIKTFLREIVQGSTVLIEKITEFVKTNKIFEGIGNVLVGIRKAIGFILLGFGELLISYGKMGNSIGLFEEIEKLFGRIRDLSIRIAELFLEIAKSDFVKKTWTTLKTVTIEVMEKGVVPLIGFISKMIGSFTEATKSDFAKKTWVILKTVLTEVIEKGVVPIITSITEFIKKVKGIVKENKDFEEALKALKVIMGFIWDVLIEVLDVGGKFLILVGKLIAKIIELGTKALEPLLGEIGPLIKAFAKFGKEAVTKGLLPVLRKLGGILEKVSEAIDNISFTALKKSIKDVLAPIKKMGELFFGVTEEAKKQEDQFKTNSNIPTNIKLGESFIEAGKASKKLGLELIEGTKEAKKQEKAIEGIVSANKKLVGISAAAAADEGEEEAGFDFSGMLQKLVDFDFGGMLQKLGKTLLKFIKGTEEGKKEEKAADVEAGFVLSSMFQKLGSILLEMGRSIFNLIMSNETVRETVGVIVEKIGSFLQPIIELLLPVVKKVGDLLIQIVLAVGPILQEIVNRLAPVLIKMIEDLLPTIIMLMEAIGPVITRILDIIIPILQELTPLIQAVLELLIELMPIIVMILDFLKNFLPLIKFLIRGITLVVHWIKQIVIGIKTVTDNFKILSDGLYNNFKPLIDGLSAAFTSIQNILSPMQGSLESVGNNLISGLTSVRDMIVPLTSALEVLKNAVDGISSGIGGGGGGIGSLWPFHNGGIITPDKLLGRGQFGMASNEGLARVQVGEKVVPEGTNSGMNITFNVKSINPREQIEEIRQLLEELFITGRLRVT